MRRLLETVKFSHTVFALPFAVLSCGLAAGGRFPPGRVLLWVVAAAVGARTAAMAFNRLADLRFDRRNPRTRGWPLSRGEVGRRAVAALGAAGALLFGLAAWRLNPWTLRLAAPTLVVILGYSLTKRFTWLCHFALGLALSIAPAGGWIAVSPGWDARWALLSAAVLLWVAGFDILYACGDVRFDRENRLHSIPARFGIPTAMSVSSGAHALSALLFVAAWWCAGLGPIAATGTAVAVVLLVLQHRWVSPADLSRLDASFFAANGLLSVVLMGTWLLDASR